MYTIATSLFCTTHPQQQLLQLHSGSVEVLFHFFFSFCLQVETARHKGAVQLQ